MDRFKKHEMRKESLHRVQEEILAERAAALGRITRTLEKHLARLDGLRHELSRVRGVARTELLASHEKGRKLARTWRWYLQVQREVNGLIDEEHIDTRYPIPGPLHE